LQCDNYHTLQIKGTLNTPAIYDCDRTKAELLGSWLKQWNLFEKALIVSVCGKRHSDTAIFDSLEDD